MKKRNEKMVTMFVYGTLKRGRHLHKTYNFHKSEFVGEDQVKGELYSLGWYPALFPDGRHADYVKGEVFRVPFNVYETVKNMEEAAGYETSEVITKNGVKAKVFYYKNDSMRVERNRIKEF